MDQLKNIYEREKSIEYIERAHCQTMLLKAINGSPYGGEKRERGIRNASGVGTKEPLDESVRGE